MSLYLWDEHCRPDFREGPEPDSVPDDAWVFVFRGGRELLVPEDNPDLLPSHFPFPFVDEPERAFVGLAGARACYALRVADEVEAPPGYVFAGLRELFGVMDEDLRALAGRGSQLLHWQETSRFCGRCGSGTVYDPSERASRCGECGLLVYPRISPAVIVGVIRDGRLLLARNGRFRGSMHSLVAGFVEVGETLEACVRREVDEEVGLRVRNIRYFGSQPWPYPSTLMLGFTAEYAGGSLCPDGEEIVEAGWYRPDALPEIPPHGSISRRIIDAFTAGQFGS